jgi:hypothetical protein
MRNERMDFVIAWVDGSDSAWRKEKQRYVDEALSGRQDIAGPQDTMITGFSGIGSEAWKNSLPG